MLRGDEALIESHDDYSTAVIHSFANLVDRSLPQVKHSGSSANDGPVGKKIVQSRARSIRT